MVNAYCLRVLLSDLFLGAVVTGCHPVTSPQDAPSVLNFDPHTVIIYSILIRANKAKPRAGMGLAVLSASCKQEIHRQLPMPTASDDHAL
jgi:hypothetical protein